MPHPRPDPPQRQRDPKDPGPAIEKRQIEAVKVVVLDDVGIGSANHRGQPGNQLGLSGVAGATGFEHLGGTVRVPDGDHEDPMAASVESLGLQIELEPAELVER